MFDKILESYQIWETEALSELMRLQKARVITIQRCDKGGGIIISSSSIPRTLSDPEKITLLQQILRVLEGRPVWRMPSPRSTKVHI